MLLAVLRRWSRCFSYSVCLCGSYYGELHVLKSSRALCPRVSSFLLALWSPRFGKREFVCVLLVHLCVCFVHVSFRYFSLPLDVGVGCGLWLWHSLDFSINFCLFRSFLAMPCASFFLTVSCSSYVFRYHGVSVYSNLLFKWAISWDYGTFRPP